MPHPSAPDATGGPPAGNAAGLVHPDVLLDSTGAEQLEAAEVVLPKRSGSGETTNRDARLLLAELESAPSAAKFSDLVRRSRGDVSPEAALIQGWALMNGIGQAAFDYGVLEAGWPAVRETGDVVAFEAFWSQYKTGERPSTLIERFGLEPLADGYLNACDAIIGAGLPRKAVLAVVSEQTLPGFKEPEHVAARSALMWLGAHCPELPVRLERSGYDETIVSWRLNGVGARAVLSADWQAPTDSVVSAGSLTVAAATGPDPRTIDVAALKPATPFAPVAPIGTEEQEGSTRLLPAEAVMFLRRLESPERAPAGPAELSRQKDAKWARPAPSRLAQLAASLGVFRGATWLKIVDGETRYGVCGGYCALFTDH